MTSYLTEQDYLHDQILSNNLAIRYLKQKIDLFKEELSPDFLGTDEKVLAVVTEGIKNLKADSKYKRKRIKELEGWLDG